MNSDRLEALLWARIDGTIQPRDLAQLEAFLTDHPESRELERQIATIAENLDGMDRVEPPPALRGRIDGALASAAAPGPAVQILTPRPVQIQRQWQNRWLAMAASLLVGTIVGYLLHPGAGAELDPSKVGATMVTPPAAEAGADFRVDLDQDLGSLSLGRSEASINADFSILSKTGLWLVMEAESGALEIGSAAHIGNAPNRLRSDGPRFDFQADGPGRHTLMIRTTDRRAPIRVSVGSGSEVLAERRIEPARIEENP
jgi:hypothetical protein